MKKIWFLLVLAVGAAQATVRHVPVKSGVVLKPGEVYTARLDSANEVEVGWSAVQAKECSMNCVEASQVGSRFAFASVLGGSKKYDPIEGKIVIEYKNVSQQPVTIDVFRLLRICDSEACQFVDNTKKGHMLVFKVNQFKSITTSKDRSYSVISGVAESGRPFRFRAIWFTDDKTFMNLEGGCTTWIKRYVDNHTPKEQYRPYIIAGQNVGDENNILLRNIDDCVGKADHFGVEEKYVFK
jgi:hypothetical protein